MYLRLLNFLRCPSCQSELTCIALENQSEADGGEIMSGILQCAAGPALVSDRARHSAHVAGCDSGTLGSYSTPDSATRS